MRSTSGNRNSRPDANSLPRLRAASSSRSGNSSWIDDDFDEFDTFGPAASASQNVEEDMDIGFDSICDGGDSQDGEEGQHHRSAGWWHSALLLGFLFIVS